MAEGKRDKNLHYKYVEISHNIPSFMQLPKRKCAKTKSIRLICAECGFEDHLISGGCDNPECFACHVKWSKKKSYDAALRVLAGLERENGAGELWHVMLSPPENADFGTKTPRDEAFIDKIIKESYELCRENGIVGGVLVVHYGPERSARGINKYLPRGEYRPHVHIFGYGERPQGPWVNARGMWVCKTLNDGQAVERDFEFIKGGLHYLLSHAARRRNKHSVRWFGRWSYSRGIGDKVALVKMGLRNGWIKKIERCGRAVFCKCPRCGGAMVSKTVYDGNGDWVDLDIKGPPCDYV